MRAFPGAERVTVDAGTCGTVVYSVTPAVQGQVRLAWRSSAGSVEHYTFPIVRTTTVRTERREAEGPQGRVVAAAETDREIVLVSAYETRSMLEPLAELTATAAAWICLLYTSLAGVYREGLGFAVAAQYAGDHALAANRLGGLLAEISAFYGLD